MYQLNDFITKDVRKELAPLTILYLYCDKM